MSTGIPEGSGTFVRCYVWGPLDVPRNAGWLGKRSRVVENLTIQHSYS
jgi:hypothetical protein